MTPEVGGPFFSTETASRLPILWGNYYLLVVVSMGWDGIDPVVSTGVVTTVSVVTGDVIIESLVEGGAAVSLPDEFSGVSQPIAAIARESPKKMFFIINVYGIPIKKSFQP